MQVTKEPLDPCQVALTIEVESDKVVQAVDRAYREYSKYVSVPGFRKGKAPMTFVKQRVPETDVRQRAAELLVEPAYAAAIEQENIEPFAQPKLELLQLEFAEKPFIFKAIVPLRPEVELGPYTGLTVEKNKYELSDENVDTQMQRMRERAAEYPIVERPVQMGDLVVADLSALVDIRPEASESRPTMIEIGADNIPGFDEQLIGMAVDEEKVFTLTYPETYPDTELANEEAEFTVRINEVHEKQIPELDDELAKKLSNGRYETVEQFRTELKADMEKSLVANSESEADSKLIDQIIAGSVIKYPPVLVEAEVDDEVKELLARIERQGVSLEDYLQQVGRTREQLVAEFTEAAKKRIEIGLLLGKVADVESLMLVDADVEATLAERAAEERTSPAAIRAMLETSGGMEALRNRAQAKKVLDFLRGSAIIQEKVVSADSTDEESEVLDDAADDAADTIEFASEEASSEVSEPKEGGTE
ncbi:MAG: trigger factor [Janthinobacterium lividum]